MPEGNDNKDINNNSTYSQQIKQAAEIGKHAVHIKQKERQLRKTKKRLSRLKTFLRFLLFCGLLSAIYFFLTLSGWYLKEDTFSKPDGETVEIVNNKLIPSNFIYNSMKELRVFHIPIFLMSVAPIKHELYKIPAIKTVYVRRYGFPARLQIIVRERIPMAVIKTDINKLPVAFVTTDKVMVTNKNFMHLAESDSTLRILVKNPEFRKDWTVERVNYIDKIAKEIETYSNEKVQYVDMRNSNDVYVKIVSTNIRLGVLDSSVFERIKRIYTILPTLNNVDGKVKYIDLSWDKVNYFKLQQEKENKPTKEEQKQ